MSVNKVIVIGNLGANPEVRTLPNSGQNVANFSLATTARFKDRNGDQQKRTEWHRVVAFGTARGHLPAVFEPKAARSTSRDGSPPASTRRRTEAESAIRTEIVALQMRLLGNRANGNAPKAGSVRRHPLLVRINQERAAQSGSPIHFNIQSEITEMDIYAIVTEKIINLLEQGIVPWRRPWTSAGLPRNLVSKKPYRGINHFLLSASKYVSPFWLTMRQANELGGHIRKGEESTVVVFWKVDDAKQSTEDLDNEETDAKARRRFLLRYYRVFNLEQCELPQAVLDKLPKIETHEHDPIEAAERIIAAMPNPPEIQHAGSKAFYSPITDRITLPPRELFASAEEYYATALHETVHSTGHQKRLAREGICEVAPFGSAVYSKEELCAEMGAAYLCAEAGISTAVIENQAAYVAGWLKKLRDDRKLLIHAAAQAQHAADYILGRSANA